MKKGRGCSVFSVGNITSKMPKINPRFTTLPQVCALKGKRRLQALFFVATNDERENYNFTLGMRKNKYFNVKTA